VVQCVVVVVQWCSGGTHTVLYLLRCYTCCCWAAVNLPISGWAEKCNANNQKAGRGVVRAGGEVRAGEAVSGRRAVRERARRVSEPRQAGGGSAGAVVSAGSAVQCSVQCRSRGAG